MSEETGKTESYIELTADIVSAYVSNNSVPAADLAALIAQVHQSLSGLFDSTAEPPVEDQKPAVDPRRSVHKDHIVCLEDGKKYKSLKRHLMAHHGLSPDEYRAKWKLPNDYPIVASGYSAARSALAKEMGLGRKPAARAEPTTPAKRGRKPKTTA